ncbi:MAG: acetyl-CoA decarbonylase/synthase complex subunit alpha, partial [Methanosarcinales archaeon]|nr:acetyl-CoA decarbonylase/synthase complex subunit alpha [Methanosarcinales archaeon]
MAIKKGQFTIENLENVQINIGSVISSGKAEEKEKSKGPTPAPEIHELRDWDMRLLKRYEPVYSPICDLCCYCTYGKCDLTGNKEGACGINMEAQQAREAMLRTLTG